MNISNFKQYLTDRPYIGSIVAMMALALLIVIISIFSIEAGELRVPVRYSYFDVRNYSLDQWYYLLAFPLFAVVTAVFYAFLSLKLYQLKGRLFALSAVALGIVVLLFALVVFSSIYQVVSIS